MVVDGKMFRSNFKGRQNGSAPNPRRRVLRMDFTSLTVFARYQAHLIHRRRSSGLTSSSMGTIEISDSGLQSRVRSRSLRTICRREPSSSSKMWLSEWDRVPHDAFISGSVGSMRCPIGYFCPEGACAFESGFGLVGFVMADHTARRSAELAVASHVAGNAADDGALDAPLCLRRREGGECQQANRGENHFHAHSPRSRWPNGSSPWKRASSCGPISD